MNANSAFYTVIDAHAEFSNAWPAPNGIALRAHNGPRILETDCVTIEQALREHAGTAFHPHQHEQSLLGPGECHPRIHREMLSSPRQELPIPEALYPSEMAAAFQSARNLFAQLKEVFRYVEPSDANRFVYGDQMRSLLILACTEVESAWRSVLIANNGATADQRLSTREYVRLVSPMRLREWRVALPGFPKYSEVAPFETWDSNAPTASIGWYDAYNRAKHDREGGLPQASLQHMISAMCGVYVMLAAQFGISRLHGANPVSTDMMAKAMPAWPLAEYYVPALVHGGNGPWCLRPLF